MGLDSECDLAVEAGGEKRIQDAISKLRNRLLGEHLKAEPLELARMVDSTGSLIAAIERLRGEGRSLRPLPLHKILQTDIEMSMATMIDPERPVDPDELINLFVDDRERPSARRRISWWVGMLAVILLLSAAWRWTPLNQWVNIETLLTGAARLKELPLVPLLILATYVIASVMAIPVTLLIVVTILAFGAWSGFAYALVGSILGALGSFALGRLFGRNIVRRMAGPRINALSRHLARRGLLAVITLRIFPIAPFAVINMVAGASHIRLRDFAFGTLIGISPAVIAIAVFTDRIMASIESPDLFSFATLMISAIIIGVGAFVLRHWLNSRVDQPDVRSGSL